MTRTYGDRIVVGAGCRWGERGGDRGIPPAWWLWQGRRYVVCEVLDHWHDRRAWWGTALPASPRAAGRGGPCHEEGLRADDLRRLAGTDAEVWRVEAAGPCWRGVYDLHHEAGDPRGPGAGWRLARIWD